MYKNVGVQVETGSSRNVYFTINIVTEESTISSCAKPGVHKPKNERMKTCMLYMLLSDTVKSPTIADERCSWNFSEKHLIIENATKCATIAKKACTSLNKM